MIGIIKHTLFPFSWFLHLRLLGTWLGSKEGIHQGVPSNPALSRGGTCRSVSSNSCRSTYCWGRRGKPRDVCRCNSSSMTGCMHQALCMSKSLWRQAGWPVGADAVEYKVPQTAIKEVEQAGLVLVGGAGSGTSPKSSSSTTSHHWLMKLIKPTSGTARSASSLSLSGNVSCCTNGVPAAPAGLPAGGGAAAAAASKLSRSSERCSNGRTPHAACCRHHATHILRTGPILAVSSGLVGDPGSIASACCSK